MRHARYGAGASGYRTVATCRRSRRRSRRGWIRISSRCAYRGSTRSSWIWRACSGTPVLPRTYGCSSRRARIMMDPGGTIPRFAAQLCGQHFASGLSGGTRSRSGRRAATGCPGRTSSGRARKRVASSSSWRAMLRWRRDRRMRRRTMACAACAKRLVGWKDPSTPGLSLDASRTHQVRYELSMRSSMRSAAGHSG